MTKVNLGEVLDVKRGASLSGDFYSNKGEKIRLTLGNFDYPSGGFKPNTSKDNIYFTGPIRSEFILKKGDIITPLTEQVAGLLGETARIPEDNLYIQSGDVGLVIPDETKLDNKYAYYLLASPLIKQQLGAGAQQTKIRHTSPEKIKDCVAWIPDLTTQHRIGVLLDSINDKIKTNNAISSELEAMAKTIYDYWFLQLDFPDENGKPYRSSGGKMVWNEELKREIPEGWEVSALGSHFNSERGLSYSTKNIETDKGIPMINLANFRPGGGAYKEDGLKHYLGEYPESKQIKSYDLVMCNTQQTAVCFSTDIIGRAMLVPDIFEGDIVSSHHVNVIRTGSEELKYYLLYLFNSDFFHKYISGYTNGTNILGLTFDGVTKYTTELPNNTLLHRFMLVATEVEKKKSAIIRENRELTSLRDFLLPMLMNGQIKVGE